MRNPLSKTITSIKPSGIRKFFDIVNTMEDAISLGVGEPDFDTPYFIRDAGIYSLEKGKTFYTSNSGLMELREEIRKYLIRKLNVEYNPKDEMIITVGGSEGIDIALRAMLDAGDEVLIPQPSYVSYEPCTILAGGKPVIIELKAEDGFKLKASQILEKVTDKTKILILPFPNNPTGSILNINELKEIAKVCIEKDLYVISDEIYCELTYEGEHASIVQVEGMKERTILINGFSKSYAMTGWRLGYATGPKEIIAQMPNESIVYFGDTARVPYGSKSRDTIIKYSGQIVKFLQTKNVKAIVIACNTASAFALDILKTEIDIPIMGVIHAGAITAAETTKVGRIGVVGTSGTISSGIYEKTIHQINNELEVIQKACPLLVPLVEEGLINDRVTDEIISRYVSELKSRHIDSLVLGCTHYPLLYKTFGRIMGEEVSLVNPAYETAKELKSLLERENLCAVDDGEVFHDFYVSDMAERFSDFASSIMPGIVKKAGIVNIEEF